MTITAAKQGSALPGNKSQVPKLRSSSRICASKLPVPNVNKAPMPDKHKTTSGRSNASLSFSHAVSQTAEKKTKPSTQKDSNQGGKSHKTGHPEIPERGSLDVMGDNIPSEVNTPTTRTGDTNMDSPAHDSSHENNNTVAPEIPPAAILRDTNNNNDGNLNGNMNASSGSNTDNAEVIIAGNTSGLPPSNPADPWHLTYNEMKAMSTRMAKLDTIERDVATLKTQMNEVVTRTRNLEAIVRNHSDDIKTFKTTISGLQATNAKHDSSIEELWSFSNNVATKADQRVKELKEAIQENIYRLDAIGDVKAEVRKQVDVHIKEITKVIKEGVTNEVRKEFSEQIKRNTQVAKKDLQNVINTNAHYCQYTRLQDQAFNNRLNLVLLGIKEDDRESAFTQAANFFKFTLNSNRVSMDVAYRMGRPPPEGSPYNRPTIVRFSYMADRNTVWRKRNNIPRDQQGNSARIQADLPKQLREDLQILYRVQRAAAKIPQYQTAEVKNYKLYLNGEEYFAWELEHLPTPLRPSSLATKTNDNVLVFYSKYSALSNHHYAPFEVQGRVYANMEQYLAYKRAKLSGQQSLINKALLAQDPVEAKAILNMLKNDHREEWKKEVSAIVTEGLQAKFSQNASLGEYLRSTAPLHLGEASRNPQGGVGFTLGNEEVTNQSKWSKQGNLLGRLLMKVRNQMIHTRQTQAEAEIEKKKEKNSAQAKSKGDKVQPQSRPPKTTTKN